ncbi:MAG: single-stranded DNA-binding protein [Armatimonadetes bacterium]|nr:single-stranded DNA-binding protein [Armatimonadota bacterium]MBS1725280.1 single-stranded DNA-binding protein [Armatimonadota bacterium]
MSVNRVVLSGRLTADPELRETSTGKSVATFTIAVQKKGKPREGEPTADFLRITTWGHSAKYVHDYLLKGRLVACDGRIQTRRWQDQTGQNRESMEIVADNVYALDRRRDVGPKKQDDDYDPFAEEAS